MRLWTPLPQSSKRQYQTQMSSVFQLMVEMPSLQRRNLQRSTAVSAMPCSSQLPKFRAMPLMSLKTRSLCSQ